MAVALLILLSLSALAVLLLEPVTVRFDTRGYPRVTLSLVFFAFSLVLSPAPESRRGETKAKRAAKKAAKRAKKQKKKRLPKLPIAAMLRSLGRILRRGELTVAELPAPRENDAAAALRHGRVMAALPFSALLFGNVSAENGAVGGDITDIAFTTSLIFIVIEGIRLLPHFFMRGG